mgnify:CR=1 FL=1
MKEFFALLSGIDASGVRGEVDYRAISLWLSATLPLYTIVGFWLFSLKQPRNYLLYRSALYKNWWNRLCRGVLIRTAAYFLILWAAFCVIKGEPKELAEILVLRMLHTMLLSTAAAAIWEATLFSGSILCVIVLEYVGAAVVSYLPVGGENLLAFWGMSRYVKNGKEYFFSCAVSAAGIAIIVLLAPRILKRYQRK